MNGAPITELDLQYVVGVQGSMTVWEPGKQPLPAKPRGKMGRPPRLLQRTTDHQPVSVKQLAMTLTSTTFKEIAWREGTDRRLQSRFAAAPAVMVRRTDGFAHVADIMVGSFYDPMVDEGCAFEELISFHGGMGGSRGYLDKSAFDAAGMGVVWQEMKHPTYPQCGTAPFIKGLSALDVLFNCGPRSAEILRECAPRENELLAA